MNKKFFSQEVRGEEGGKALGRGGGRSKTSTGFNPTGYVTTPIIYCTENTCFSEYHACTSKQCRGSLYNASSVYHVHKCATVVN